MATMAIPLREMSVKVQHEAVSAQRAYWSVAEDLVQRRSQLFLWVNVRLLNLAMGRLVKTQQTLINCLSNARTRTFTPELFAKVASDLDNVVSLTNSFIEEAYEMPRECVGVWSERLTKISELNGHLDNYAESFHIAADETCTALLADAAGKISADVLVPSH